MSSNGSSLVDERLRPLIEPIQQELERIKGDRKTVEDEFKEVEKEHQQKMRGFDQEEHRLKDALRAFGVKTGSSKNGKSSRRKGQSGVGVTRANGTATGFGISMELGDIYADKILEFAANKEAKGEEPVVTQKEIYKSLDDDQTKASAAFRWLRSIEFLGKAGSDPSSRRELWRVLDRDAAKQALAEAQRRRDEDTTEVANA